MTIKAMKLALEALEFEAEGWECVPPITREAIAVLRERLAQPTNPDPDPLHLSRILHELAGAASMCWTPRPTGVFDSQEAIKHVVAAIAEIRERLAQPEQEPRQWQGLTEEDVKRCYFGSRADFMDYARAIEAKLREKNT